MDISDMRNKKIAVVGLGIENLHLVIFLLKKGITNITIYDERDKNTLNDRIKTIKNKEISFILGRNKFKGSHKFDILFRSPGVSLANPEIKKAKKNGVIIYSAIKLFFDLCSCPIIGVTGTKGKGTTSSLIYEILKTDKRKAYLAGNIGKAPFEYFNELDKQSIVVLELSSFQLEDLNKSPYISVITNISPEHLKAADFVNPNYHKNMNEYLKAKRNIVKFQGKNDYVVLNFNDIEIRKFKNHTKAKISYFCFNENEKHTNTIPLALVDKQNIIIKKGDKIIPICKISKIKLLGNHNLENICAASMATYLAGASIKSIQKAITTFKGLEHRLEFVKEINGVKYYNDTFATTPNATLTAINAFNNPIILILGGVDKGNDFTQLAERVIKKNIKKIILIGASAGKIEKIIRKAEKKLNAKAPEIITGLKDMGSIINIARNEAQNNDIVLLAPACASFDMFKNYKERGREFKEEINKL